MPSSTSSSERSGRAWLGIWLSVILLAALALGAVEWHWRAAGLQPTVRDSMALWSAARARVDRARNPLVFIGASRTEYGISLAVAREELPGCTPIQLAINGHYPLAVLRDLAADKRFSGTVLVDVDADGLRPVQWDHSAPWVEYWHRIWSPSVRVHRALLSIWQGHALIANPELGALASLRRRVEGKALDLPPIVYHAERGGDVDYTQIDAAAMRRHFEASARAALGRVTAPDPAQWLRDVAPVHDWVRAIQARGGEVIFYQPPAEGAVREVGDRLLPRALYWNRFALATPGHALMLRDVPAVARIALPDGSHVDQRDKAAYTRGLLDAVRAQGWLAGRCPAPPAASTPARGFR